MPQATGDYSLIIVWSTVILLSLVAGIVIFILLYQNKHREFLIQKKSFQENLLQSKIEIREQTLSYVARELHDNLGQTASLIKIHLNTLALADTPQSNQKIEETKELVRQLIADLKFISMGLTNDMVTKIGLVKSIEKEAERINRLGQLTVTLESEGIPFLVNNDVSVILYRMVQEILNNAVKHSQATAIRIILKLAKNILTLVIFDNGVGFDPETPDRNGMGLHNLQNRAQQIHAQCRIQSSPNAGTTVSIELPITDDTQPDQTSPR
ncbi:MAG: hypothetical protein JST37_03665 [Bacteroidetes bacterium]|jgi:signal transduction histidine kinase|nr:hypothetical protein [Bacteroidota bacterium]MBS1981549.1 hypothetical protein [Bacteroidota bacterium]